MDSRDHRLGAASWAALPAGANLSADPRKGRRRNGRAHPGTTILRAARKRRPISETCGAIRAAMLVHSPDGQIKGRRGIVGDVGSARRFGTQPGGEDLRSAEGRSTRRGGRLERQWPTMMSGSGGRAFSGCTKITHRRAPRSKNGVSIRFGVDWNELRRRLLALRTGRS